MYDIKTNPNLSAQVFKFSGNLTRESQLTKEEPKVYWAQGKDMATWGKLTELLLFSLFWKILRGKIKKTKQLHTNLHSTCARSTGRRHRDRRRPQSMQSHPKEMTAKAQHLGWAWTRDYDEVLFLLERVILTRLLRAVSPRRKTAFRACMLPINCQEQIDKRNGGQVRSGN